MNTVLDSLQDIPVQVQFYTPENGDDEFVLLSQSLWNAFTSILDDADLRTDAQNHRFLSISLARCQPRMSEKQKLDTYPPLESIIANARNASNTSPSSLTSNSVCVPEAWKNKLNISALFSQNDLLPETGSSSRYLLSIVAPAPLKEVILFALSQEAYDQAQNSFSDIQKWLFDDRRLLRLGDTVVRNVGDVKHSYEVANIEPLAQGYGSTEETDVFVLLSPQSAMAVANGKNHSPAAVNGTASRRESFSDDSETFDIDENFLANSMLDRRALPHNEQTSLNGSDSPNSNVFSTKFLDYVDNNSEDWDSTIVARTVDLARVGIFNNEWAIARESSGSESRLVRILTTRTPQRCPDTVFLSPVLSHNLCSRKERWQDKLSLELRACSFGTQPPIPVAKTLTLARVASPISVDRHYQSLFLQSLKSHFKKTRRLLKKGDLIVVPLDNRRAHEAEQLETLGIDLYGDKARSLHGLRGKQQMNAVVHFLVTNLEYQVGHHSGANQNGVLDAYSEAALGELGCWIDPNVTQILQVGVEHSYVPDVSRYLAIGTLSHSHIWDTPSSEIADTDPSNKLFEKLLDFSGVFLNPDAVDLGLNHALLIKGPSGTGKATLACEVARNLGVHLLEINCYSLIGETDVQTEGNLRARFDKASSCSPCIILLRHVDALAQTSQTPESEKEPAIVGPFKECVEKLSSEWKVLGYPVILLGTTCHPDKIPDGILSCFKDEMTATVPEEPARLAILKVLLRGVMLSSDVSLKSIAVRTAALTAADLRDLVEHALLNAMTRVSEYAGANVSTRTIFHSGLLVSALDFDKALDQARAAYSESIGAPKIPNVSWDDVGGLAKVKSEIVDTIQLPLEHPELFVPGLKKRSGILLYGPPGTGKTMIAKAVATSFSLNFFSIKGPELLNMYIGESEANVRRVFQRARDAKPCVIFFDELDSIAPKRGNHGDSGGVMDRIVSQLLAELDGMSSGDGSSDVFVIGATNRPDLLDSALLRPGRFDRMLYLGVSDNHDAQFNILQALTRKFKMDPGLDLRQIAERCLFNFTGADFYALCSDAMLKAMSRKAEEVDKKLDELNSAGGIPGHPFPLTPQYYLSEFAADIDTDVVVTYGDFDQALNELIPSVSEEEMQHYRVIQSKFTQPES